jgi:hypothetical protein
VITDNHATDRFIREDLDSSFDPSAIGVYICSVYDGGFRGNTENETKPGLVIETALQFPIRIGRSKAYACRNEVCKFDSGEDERYVEYGDSLWGMKDVCVTLADREKDPERWSESREAAQSRVSNFKELFQKL